MNTQSNAVPATVDNVIAFPGEKKPTFLGVEQDTWYGAGKLAGAAAVGAGALYGYQWLTSPSEDDEAAAAAAAKAEFDRLHAAIKESGDSLSTQIGGLASRLDAMDGRVAKVEGAVGNLHHRIQALEAAKPAAPAFDVGQLMEALEAAKPAAPAFDVGQLMEALPATVAGIAAAVQNAVQPLAAAPVAEAPTAAPVAETPTPAAPVAAAPAVETLHRPQPAAVKPQGKR